MRTVIPLTILISSSYILCCLPATSAEPVHFHKNERVPNDNWETQYTTAEKYFSKRQWNKAIEAYFLSFKASTPSERARSMMRIGDIHLIARKPEIAEFSYKKSLEFCKTNEGIEHYAEFLHQHNRADEAEKLAEFRRQPNLDKENLKDNFVFNDKRGAPFPPDLMEDEKLREPK